LKRFFEALRNSGVRPVRIAFLGDSFIEGDILVADFRNSLQKMYGGHGAGFVPIASAATQYRSTVSLKSTGWKAYSILNDKQYPYTLSGMLFEPSSGTAEIRFQTGKAYSSLKSVNSLKFIYDRNEATTMQFASNASDTITAQLPPTDIIYQYTFDYDSIHSGTLSFANAQNLRALGVVLEDNTGITVDNFSLRGNSGMSLIGLDVDACKAMGEIRSYDLIILQYGLNVADASMLDYGWYRSRMNDVINHLRQCFPNSDFLLLSVSDRGNQYNGEFKTMPAILALLNTQRKIAQQTQIPFWNMFGAMGGENSIVRFVNNGWAGKDYTHLTFRGGTEISQRLIKALMQEKELYE
jgi:hypothetical protein